MLHGMSVLANRGVGAVEGAMKASPQAGAAGISVPPKCGLGGVEGLVCDARPVRGCDAPAGRFGHIGPSESVLLIRRRTGAPRHLTHFPIPEEEE